MVMVGLAVGAWVLGAIATPNVSGGTPEQNQLLQAALNTIPTCWKESGGSPAKVVVSSAPLRKGSSAAEGLEMNAEYVVDGQVPDIGGHVGWNKPEPEAKAPSDFVWIMPALFPVLQGQKTPGENCVPEHKMDSYEVLVHELAHRLQNRTGKKDVAAFLAIRYQKAHDALVADPAYQEAVAAYESASAAKDHDAMCAAVGKYDAAFKRHRIPERFDGDDHALDGYGAEYFAIAIETLATRPDVFCSNYSQTEQAFLLDHFGSCLRKMKNIAPCLLDAGPASATGSPAGAASGASWLAR